MPTFSPATSGFNPPSGRSSSQAIHGSGGGVSGLTEAEVLEEQAMDEEMEELVEGGWGFGELKVEVDFEYEYDAPGFFDFCRPESAAEERASERWFEFARSYPPSPYVVRLSQRECVPMEISNAEKPKVESICHTIQSLYSVEAEYSEMDETKGPISYNPSAVEMSKPKTKLHVKAPLARSSTLMKPTASHLAKQNRIRGVNATSQLTQRFDKPLAMKGKQILEKPIVSENQASKRQKLEGGLLCKVLHMQQQSNLTHKTTEKNVLADGHCEPPRLKVTIPKEPELVTARRAQRMRPKHGRDILENVPQSIYKFRARPLNRKIFEAPSMPLRQKTTPQLPVFQEFNLKTSGRAMQHTEPTYMVGKMNDHVVQKERTTYLGQTSTADCKKLQCPPTQSQRPKLREHKQHEDDGTTRKFKALPLNQKIFSSKGDMGVFVTSKPQLTTPMAFSFSTDKRFQQNPPTELFSKLSLTSDLKQNIRSEQKIQFPRPAAKVSKENISEPSQQEFKGFQSGRDDPMQGRGRNFTNAYGSSRTLTAIRSRENMCSIFGIR